MKNKWFTNWTDEPFSYPYNSEEFIFGVGESKLLPEYLADHFGKHLTDKVLHGQNKQANDASRGEFLRKCHVVPAGEFEPSSDEQSSIKAEIEAINSEVAPEIKKRGRPKKVETEMEKFDGLNENEAVSV